MIPALAARSEPCRRRPDRRQTPRSHGRKRMSVLLPVAATSLMTASAPFPSRPVNQMWAGFLWASWKGQTDAHRAVLRCFLVTSM
jgi:hypothetical protein